MEILNITSAQNDLVKYCTKLQNSKFRKKEKVILLDGEKTIQGLIDDNFEFEYVFLKEDNILKNKIKSKNIVFVNDAILKKISTTNSKSPLIGIIKEPLVDKKIFKTMDRIALIDGIKDAGNLGTIIRSAAAFSFDGIILFNDCVDLYSTKVIRSSTQNMFKLPIYTIKDINFIKELKKTHTLISTVVDSKKNFINYDFNKKFILALGSEAKGLSKEILDLSDEKLSFMINKNVESLNLAICASIAFALIDFNIFKK